MPDPETSVKPAGPIFHLSDLHFGPHHVPAAADALLRLIHDLQPGLVAATGDFTHRAKPTQYRQAAAWLAALPAVPLATAPGNHDVPLYRFWERLFAPYGQYRRFIHPENCRPVTAPGISLLALDTTCPTRRIVEGRFVPGHLAMSLRLFAEPFAGCKVVAAHHPFGIPAEWRYGRNLDPTGAVRRAWGELGVELVLGGHLHWSYMLEPVANEPWVLHVGTATTTRGRGPERGIQSAASIRIEPRAFVWTIYRYEPAAKRWSIFEERTLPRRRGRFSALP